GPRGRDDGRGSQLSRRQDQRGARRRRRGRHPAAARHHRRHLVGLEALVRTARRIGNARAFANVFVCAWLLSGCASLFPQTAELREGLPEGLPERVELKSVPFFPQDEYQCGPAALATSLAATGVKVTPTELVPQVYLPERKGSLQVEMLAAARRH